MSERGERDVLAEWDEAKWDEYNDPSNSLWEIAYRLAAELRAAREERDATRTELLSIADRIAVEIATLRAERDALRSKLDAGVRGDVLREEQRHPDARAISFWPGPHSDGYMRAVLIFTDDNERER